MTKADANRKMHDLINQDPTNTFCEGAGRLYNDGWHVKCTRGRYKGIQCGGGTHELVWSSFQYKSRRSLTSRLGLSRSGRTESRLEHQPFHDTSKNGF